MATERIAIEGMHCANCSALIEKMVGRMDGVGSCEVNLAANNGTVTYDSDVTSMAHVSNGAMTPTVLGENVT